MLTVLRFHAIQPGSRGGTPGAHYACRCDCGREVLVHGEWLRRGVTRSCGCLRKPPIKKPVHGHTAGPQKSPEYRAWQAMLTRCTNPNQPNYRLYGGRGIGVDLRWQGEGGFARFLEDMGPKPEPKKAYSIERRNNQLGYSPPNCYWATRAEQSRNKRDNHVITWNGETKCLTDWAIELGLLKSVLASRLARGWSIREAFTAPVPPMNSQLMARTRASTRFVTHNGETRSLAEWSERLGLPPSTLRMRLVRGWPIDQALAPGASLRIRPRR